MVTKVVLKAGSFFFLALWIVGCAGHGASVLPSDRSNYNIAIQRSNDEQLLLNLVRLVYRDTPLFLEVSSVAAQFTYGATAEANATLPERGLNVFGLGGSAVMTEKPTISYTPLQGEKFIGRFLSRVPLETVFLLYHSGWSIERLFRLCLQRLGGFKNAPSASGPTPQFAPTYKKFARVSELFRILQNRDALTISWGGKKETPGLAVQVGQEALGSPELLELNKLLGTPTNKTLFVLSTYQLSNNRDSIKVETRSLLGILYYLSQSVKVPKRDKELGKVTITRYPSGEPFDWTKVTEGLLLVRSQPKKPDQSAVAVNYRNSWFYVDDSDLHSKSTLSLLAQIFALQAGKIKSIAPLLTLPVGQ